MVDFNPSYPDELGLELLLTRDQKNRVWSGAPSRWMRLRSTGAETISALRLSASVDPLVHSSIPTVIDVVEEGDEFTALPKLARLVPNSDNVNDGWTTQAGGSTNLYQSIDQSTTKWPNPALTTHIRSLTPTTQYACGVNAAIFNSGGAAENGRIYWVGVGAILQANTGFRKLDVKLLIDGTVYDPAGGSTRDVHGFGAMHEFWWGEINPATSLPWTPADIANFDTQADWGIRVRSSLAATTTHYPTVVSLSLNVTYAEVENRVAVGVWRRPEDIGEERLLNVTTDALRKMPLGTANWSKQNTRNYLFNWRQSVSPSEYGPVLADDVRWNGGYQDLGTSGHPAGIVFPLSDNGDEASATGLCSDTIAYDVYGRPQEAFDAESRAAYGIALVSLVGSLPVDSADSYPYRMDLADLVGFKSGTGTTGQRLTPASTQTYIGVRLPIIPPATADGTLTISVFQVAGAQIGGSFTMTADEVRAIPATADGLRYVSGFFSSAVALTGSTQYEIRISANTTANWIVFAPDCSLSPANSFGGTTNGAVINGSHQTSRDMCVVLIKQPDAPASVTATVFINEVAMPDESTREVEHVEVTWTAPVSPLGASFKRYELERQLDGDSTWTRIANLNDASLLTFEDHLVPRNFEATYRVRSVSTDGRISAWQTSNAITPEEGDYDVLLTSNHDPSLEVVFDIPDQGQSFTFLSTDRDEVLQLHGADYQVVFSQAEDRGVGWSASIELNFGEEVPPRRVGNRIYTELLAITRSGDIPFVACMDFQGTLILGHVRPSDAQQKEPGHRYTASIEVTPTHTVELPVEVEP
jgi:hypothetical protein